MLISKNRVQKEQSCSISEVIVPSPETLPPRNANEALIKDLKAFRLTQSRSENIKPYYIFNNNQIHDLIRKSPTDKNTLLKVSGFGPIKVEKYGDTILEILKKHQ